MVEVNEDRRTGVREKRLVNDQSPGEVQVRFIDAENDSGSGRLQDIRACSPPVTTITLGGPSAVNNQPWQDRRAWQSR